jgi:O-antigen/teichoic acid export membrane protein
VYGPAYGPAEACGRVLLAGLPLYTAVGVLWFVLLALDGEREVLVLALSSAAVAVLSAALLVPAAGAVGASWAYLLAHVPLCAGGWCLLQRRIRVLSSAPAP